MQSLFEQVCDLQPQYSEKNTAVMSMRGSLIRNDIPTFLGSHRAEIAGALNLEPSALGIEGRDGTGLKSRVPWVRFYSEVLSPAAHVGWYCGYLFRYQGDGVYLILCHASTRWEWHNPRPRPIREIQQLVDWGRGILKDEIWHDPALTTPVDLTGTNRLAEAYARSTCIAKFYPRSAIPTSNELMSDALSFAGSLRRIYEAVGLGLSPDAAELQRETIEAAIAAFDRGHPNAGTGQGFGLTGAERKAVELRAMELARQKLVDLGFQSIKDKSAKHSWDFEAMLGQNTYLIEVKGTTGQASSVILTAKEVIAQRKAWPQNALIVVENIQLARDAKPKPIASAGAVRALVGWDISEVSLKPLAYQYATPGIGWH